MFFSWFKGLFCKKTKWKNGKNKLIERLSKGKNIRLNTRLIVAEGQNALILGNNKLCDVFYPGDHILTPATLPKVNKVCKLSKPHKNFRTKKLEYPQTFRGEIIYVNMQQMPLNFVSSALKIKEKDFGIFRYKVEYEAIIAISSVKQFGKYFISKMSKKDDKSCKKHIQRIINRDIKKLLKSELKIEDIMFDNSKLNEIINNQSISLSKMGISLNEISIKKVLPTKRSLKRFNNNINDGNFELYYYDSKLTDGNSSGEIPKDTYVLPSREEILGIYSSEKEDYITNQDQQVINDDVKKWYIPNIYQSPEEDSEKEENICPNCGAMLFEGAIFCHKCGVRLLKGEEND